MRSIIACATLTFVFAALSCACIASGKAQERTLDAVAAALNAKPVEIAATDNELRRLLKQRYNAAASELKDLCGIHLQGRLSLNDVCRAIEGFAEAGSEMAETPVARVSELELALDVAKAIERMVNVRHSEGQEPRHAVEHARVCRLGIEIDLVRAREAAKAAREPK